MRSINEASVKAQANIAKQIEQFDERTNLLTATENAFIAAQNKAKEALESETMALAMASLNTGV
eukprot:gene14215-20185_t